jgi:hypothetical protein
LVILGDDKADTLLAAGILLEAYSMKNKTVNGAANRTANTNTMNKALARLSVFDDRFKAECERLVAGERDLEAELDRSGIALHDTPRTVQRLVAEQRLERVTVKCEIEVPAWLYGHFCTAAAVYGLASWKDALQEYLVTTATDWANNSYHLDR